MTPQSLSNLAIQVIREPADLRVVASVNQPDGPVTMVARFSGSANAATLTVRHGDTHLVFERAKVAQHSAISGLLRLIADEVKPEASQHSTLLEALFHSLFIYCSRIAATESLPAWRRVAPDVRVARAIELLNRDISKRWTVELLAKAVGLSRAALAKRFLAVHGLPPMRYLTQRRMQVAAALLFASDVGLAEVAARVGYQSEFAFNRVFRRYYHVPPGQYRLRISRSFPERAVTQMAA